MLFLRIAIVILLIAGGFVYPNTRPLPGGAGSVGTTDYIAEFISGFCPNGGEICELTGASAGSYTANSAAITCANYDGSVEIGGTPCSATGTWTSVGSIDVAGVDGNSIGGRFAFGSSACNPHDYKCVSFGGGHSDNGQGDVMAFDLQDAAKQIVTGSSTYNQQWYVLVKPAKYYPQAYGTPSDNPHQALDRAVSYTTTTSAPTTAGTTIQVNGITNIPAGLCNSVEVYYPPSNVGDYVGPFTPQVGIVKIGAISGTGPYTLALVDNAGNPQTVTVANGATMTLSNGSGLHCATPTKPEFATHNADGYIMPKSVHSLAFDRAISGSNYFTIGGAFTWFYAGGSLGGLWVVNDLTGVPSAPRYATDTNGNNSGAGIVRACVTPDGNEYSLFLTSNNTFFDRVANVVSGSLTMTTILSSGQTMNGGVYEAICFPDPTNAAHYGFFYDDPASNATGVSFMFATDITNAPTGDAAITFPNYASNASSSCASGAPRSVGPPGFAWDNVDSVGLKWYGGKLLCNINFANPLTSTTITLRNGAPTGVTPTCGSGSFTASIQYDAVHNVAFLSACGRIWLYNLAGGL
jgi:hypothetical protein